MLSRERGPGKFIPVVDESCPNRQLGHLWLPANVIAHLDNITGVSFPAPQKGGHGQLLVKLKWRTIRFEAEPGAPGWKRGLIRDRVMAFPPSELHHLHRMAGDAWQPSTGLDG